MAKNEIPNLTDAELVEKIQEEKAGLNKMKLNHLISPLENPSKIRANRRNIARMATEATKRKTANK